MADSESPPTTQLESTLINTSQILQNQEQNLTVSEGNRTKNEEDEGLKVKVVLPKIKLAQRLNPSSPADRALAFSLKMINKRKASQFKMIDSYRKDLQNPQELLGSVSRVIQKQNFILNHSYLRENHYATIQLTPRKSQQPTLLPKLPLEEKKKIIKKEIEILNKSKLLSLHYEAKKIVIDILMNVIEKSVEYYLKKRRFYYKPAPKKISLALAQIIGKKSRGERKASLTLSRVIDISIANQQNEDDSSQNSHSKNSDDDDSDDEYSDDDDQSKKESGSEKDENEDQQEDKDVSSESSGQQKKEQSGLNSGSDLNTSKQL